LKGDVELTEERAAHIAERHPELLPEHQQWIAETLAAPDQVRRSVRFGSARLFSRYYEVFGKGKYVVVVVVSGLGANERHWIIAAYAARKLTEGVIE
jgi:hypothetical protein